MVDKEVLSLAQSEDRQRSSRLTGGKSDGIPLGGERDLRQGERNSIGVPGEAEVQGRTKLQRPMALQADRDRIVVE